ncbi:MAG: hypothetical protein EHM68_09645 [Lysobacterales bacterium]|nr:MAG: hypothetical protein EHM68_09645 [Xanthomonadales bacterium]
MKRPVSPAFALALALVPGPAWVAEAKADLGPGALQPDLIIEDAQVAGANPNRLRVRVANRGLAPAAETQITLVYQRGEGSARMAAPIPQLQAGERQWFIVEVGASLAEADRVVLRIDEPPQVAESDENNNRYLFE